MGIIVISLGGSVISQEDKIDVAFLRNFSKLIKSETKGSRFIITCGGGYVSKQYVNAVAEFTKSNYIKDLVAIATTKANALLVRSSFGEDAVVADGVGDAAELIKQNRIVVMGGIVPGITTDSVAALSAEAADAKLLINVSRIGGIYEEHHKGKVLPKLTYDTLIEYGTKHDQRVARSNFIFDIVACKLAKRAGIKLHFIGTSMTDLKKAISDTSHSGTIVS
jgi:uridylate kinase